MSDYEMIMVFNETFDFLITSFGTFLSMVFAFLVASSLLAEKLNRLLAGIVVALFTGASMFFTLMSYNVGANLGSLAEQIKMAVADGRSELGWVGFVANNAPIGVGLRALALLMLLGYIASLIFFFHQRRLVASIR